MFGSFCFALVDRLGDDSREMIYVIMDLYDVFTSFLFSLFFLKILSIQSCNLFSAGIDNSNRRVEDVSMSQPCIFIFLSFYFQHG